MYVNIELLIFKHVDLSDGVKVGQLNRFFFYFFKECLYNFIHLSILFDIIYLHTVKTQLYLDFTIVKQRENSNEIIYLTSTIQPGQ